MRSLDDSNNNHATLKDLMRAWAAHANRSDHDPQSTISKNRQIFEPHPSATELKTAH
jgi:hypothetical protein